MNPNRFTDACTWRSPVRSPRIPDHTLARYPGAVRAPEQHTGVELTRLLMMLRSAGADTIVTAANLLHAAFPDLQFWGTADLIAEGDYVVGQWEGGLDDGVTALQQLGLIPNK